MPEPDKSVQLALDDGNGAAAAEAAVAATDALRRIMTAAVEGLFEVCCCRVCLASWLRTCAL